MDISYRKKTGKEFGWLKHKREIQFQKVKINAELLLLTLPAVIYYFIWHYLPIGGLVLAFKEYRVDKGIFSGDWVGFKNFEFFFTSQDALRITLNTIGYGMLFLVVDILAGLTIALLLFEIRSRLHIKIYQTIMILPRFLSWVIVSFIAYAFFNPIHGFANTILQAMGLSTVDWYTTPKYWPLILLFFQVWKSVGMNSIIYYAFLMGIDAELYEAAVIDGASRWRQTLHISIPSLLSLVTILGILNLGSLFNGDFGLFYQIPRNVGLLYPVTDIIDTYVYRSLEKGSYPMATAIGMFQSVAAFIMIVGSNWVVKKVDPEKSLF